MIVCVGESFVDLLAEAEIGDVGRSERFTRAAGGAVSNVAIGIARLGGAAAFIGAVGDDPFGSFLTRTLAEHGVDVRGVRVVPAPTPLIFVARGRDGWRDFYPANWPGADTRLTEADLDSSLMTSARCVHFGGVTLAAQPGRSACLAAARIGRESGALVTFDPNVRPRIFPQAAQMRDIFAEACAAAHLVKCSHEDLSALGASADDPAALLGGLTRATVVTIGRGGCRWATADGGRGEIAAPRIDAVDTTGAGDAFMAALLWRLCAADTIDIDAAHVGDAARWAVVASAAACQREGAIASLPTAHDLETMVAAIS